MNDFIKKPNVEDDYTAEQIQELAKCAEDIVYFCTNYIRVQHPKLGAIPFEPYEYQVRMLKEFQANQFTLVLAGRQLGKSTIIAMYLLWFAMFNFDKTVLVASNKNPNAMLAASNPKAFTFISIPGIKRVEVPPIITIPAAM